MSEETSLVIIAEIGTTNGEIEWGFTPEEYDRFHTQYEKWAHEELPPKAFYRWQENEKELILPFSAITYVKQLKRYLV